MLSPSDGATNKRKKMQIIFDKKNLLTTCLLIVCLGGISAQTIELRGKIVTNTNDGEAASFAIVSIVDHNIKTICDINGRFELRNIPTNSFTLQVECLGYITLKRAFNLSKSQDIVLRLEPNSFALQEVEVMAKKNRRGKVIVDEAALEYIHPTSLGDVFLLLPGSVYRENNLNQFSQISSRQVGSDANSSLGVSIVTDGAPISNDGIRSQLVGVTEGSSSSSDTETLRRTGINQGADMRYISTDHIQSIEFTKGISSARYGNLSSGMISISSKHGVTPLRIRLKSDLKNRLGYAGKGWRLGERWGTLHGGVDFLHSMNDAREEMDKFSRLTGQIYYNNKVKIAGHTLDLDGRLSQTITVNQMKKDELTYQYNESYEANYSRTALMLKGNMSFTKKWLEKLEVILSTDFTHDKITRHRMVLSGSGPMNIPLAHEEGEHEGLYLPGRYYSDFYIDNKPLNLFAQLNANSRVALLRHTTLNLQYGIEYTNVKNHGAGAVIADERRPPFPYDNSYMRPRPNYAIPALGTNSLYVQADFFFDSGGRHLLMASLGGRASMLTNLPKNYLLHNQLHADPRINLSYTYGQQLKNTFRIGYGEESKMPTLDYLYPEKLYKDFYMLNAFTNQPEHRHLITYTHVFDVANHRLRANKNRKVEMGWDLDYKKFNFALTAFYEHSNTGFEYFKQYHPITYDLYSTLKPGADISGRRPEKSDYIKEQYSVFTTAQKVMNSSKVTKRGIEYRMIFPKIRPLMTTIEVNGAYYQTDYASSLPLYYYPAVKIGNKEYPYVCIYDNQARNQYKRLNSNIWLNTHIPRFSLILTNFLQIVWMNTSQYKDNRQYLPKEYMDMDGRHLAVGEDVMAKINNDDDIFRYFKRTILPVKYARNEMPVSLLWNIKATKEFKHGTKLSFFVNGLLDINPRYLSGSKITQREWHDPYFGLEIYFNLNL